MRVTTTIKGDKVVARLGNRQHTQRVDPNISEAGNHGTAARTLVSRVAPGYRRVEILNSVQCEKAVPGKSTFVYKD